MSIPKRPGLLAREAQQLSRNLANLLQGLKGSTADALAGSAASLVNSAVHAILRIKPSAISPEASFLAQRRDRTWRESSDPWHLNTIGSDRQDLDDDWRYPRDIDDDPDDLSSTEEETSGRPRLLAAVFAACQAAVWWLRGNAGGPWAAAGVGLVAGAATLAIGITPVTTILALCELLLAGGVLLRPI